MSSETMQSADLRHRQAERVREELRNHFVRLVMEKGFEGFTMAELADAAGVSVRTLYRYFPNREALALAVREQVEQSQKEMEIRRGPGDWTENPNFFASTFEVFASNADTIKAGRAMRESRLDPSGARERTNDMRAQVEANEDVPADAADQITGLLRLLGSTDAWLRLTEEDIGLESREAGYAVQWAMEVLLEAVKDVDGPLRPKGKANK